MIKFLILLSPGLINHGVAINDDIRTLSEVSLLTVASSGLKTDEKTAKWINKKCPSKHKKNIIFNNDSHGTDILKKNPELGKHLTNWLKSILEQ